MTLIDPLLEGSTEASELDSPAIKDVLENRVSFADLPVYEFLPAHQLRDSKSNDLYGESAYGLFAIPRGMLAGAYCLFLGESGQILIEQNAGIKVREELLDAYTRVLFDVEDIGGVQNEGHLISLVSSCCYCYWHWMMDCLPKVVLAEMSGYTGDYLVPVPRMSPWGTESLELLGISTDRIVYPSKNMIFVDVLYIPTYFSGFSTVTNPDNPVVTKYLRQLLLERVESYPESRTRRLFVPRRGAGVQRKIENQSDVMNLLDSYGFEELYFEDLSQYQQIQLASETEILIAPHGSGLVNELFMPKGGHVIEYTPYGGGNACLCYRYLCAQLGLNHYQEQSSADLGENIQVDTDSLRGLLERIS